MQHKNTLHTDHGLQKKIALINDFCGFGRCSLTVSLPIVSAMGVQGCPVPTAVFSNHTAFDSFYKLDMTKMLEDYLAEWEKLKLRFDAVLAGYLAGPGQFEITENFIKTFLKEDGLFILDPVMGDNGRLYTGCESGTLLRMKKLLSLSDVLTPNLTEACFLTDTDYETVKCSTGARRTAYVKQMALMLSGNMHNGQGQVVISGVETSGYISNCIYSHGEFSFIRTKRTGASRCGTGDIFSSVVSVGLMVGNTLTEAVRTAAVFIKECIMVSDRLHISLTDGVAFEEVLGKLHKKGGNDYEKEF